LIYPGKNLASLADIAISSRKLAQETYNFGGNWQKYIRELSCSSRDDLQLSLGISRAAWLISEMLIAARNTTNGATYCSIFPLCKIGSGTFWLFK